MRRAVVVVAAVRAIALVAVIALASVVAWFVFAQPIAHAITIVAASVLALVAIGGSALAAARVIIVARAAETLLPVRAEG
jgi:hypothetical protein